LMTVSNTGHGMNEKTMRRIFEPSFTTHEPASLN
jgi:signal transduction histidine kinase